MDVFSFELLSLCGALFAAMLALQELGRRRGKRRQAQFPEGMRAGLAASEGAVFGLLGLLIAFSFNGAAQRLDDRRQQITAEANAIGTAWMRLDLLEPEAQTRVREAFVRYFDARLAVYRALPDVQAARAAYEEVHRHQELLWDELLASGELEDKKLVLPELNAMFDVGEDRTQLMMRHPPRIVFVLLFALALGCAWLAGFAMSSGSERPLGHMLALAGVIAVVFYVILDLEHPRRGLINMAAGDQVLLDLRAGIDEAPGGGAHDADAGAPPGGR